MGLALLVMLIFGSLAIIIFSRRFKQYLSAERSSPTPSDDVWAMHVVPPDYLPDESMDDLDPDEPNKPDDPN